MAESNELKIIKKKYGEKFMHLCRELFPTILENEGQLMEILESSFGANSRTLGEDIINRNMQEEFNNFILSKYHVKEMKSIDIGNKTPYDLLDEAGYDLYECENEDDIQSYKKYYQSEEELCTFNGGRLNSCVVFWAVKKDADKINRIDFKEPKRDDEYGTSVMSIQFSRGKNCTVSIKNRYNHTVNNPDATFGNDLDRIIPGLTQSFKKLLAERGMDLDSSNIDEFGMLGYRVANDGKLYNYKYEMNDICYCPGNVIIEHGNVKKLEPEKEELIDYFILDKKRKTFKLYDSSIKDSFTDCFENIEKIEIIKNPDREKHTRIISIQTKDSKTPIKIEIDKENNIVGYENLELKKIGNKFIKWTEKVSYLKLPELEEIGNDFMPYNQKNIQLDLPKLKKIGNKFLKYNYEIRQLYLPNLREVGDGFLSLNQNLSQLDLPVLSKVGNKFLSYNREILELELPYLIEAGEEFLKNNVKLKSLRLLKLEKVNSFFLQNNKELSQLDIPNLTKAGHGFLLNNINLMQLNLPNLTETGDRFFYYNKLIRQINLPKLTNVGNGFLFNNKSISQLSLPRLIKTGNYFLNENNAIESINLPEIKEVGDYFLNHNNTLTFVQFPKLEKVGNDFIFSNEQLSQLSLPMLKVVGDYFLSSNEQLEMLYLPELEKIGYGFLGNNIKLSKLYLPKLKEIYDDFLFSNEQNVYLIENMHKPLNINISQIAELDKKNKINVSEATNAGQVIKEQRDLQK